MYLEKINNLDQKIGQLIVTGFPGSKPDKGFLDLVKKDKVGNVIFFSYNIKSKEQAASLCRQLQEFILEETGVLPFLTVDEEGGVVSRLPVDMAVLPSAMAQGRFGERLKFHSREGNSIYEGSKIVGAELKALGINFNLAPVLDVNSNPRNPVIGVRSFGNEPVLVSKCAVQAVRGYLDAGILCTGKHFPGHGDTDVDSHLGLPSVDKSREQLEREELLPFQNAIAEGIPAITIAHMLLPAFEPEKIPCTMSKKVITGLLRDQLQFKGLVITDCMEMDAIRKYYGTPAGVVEALRAGADLIFISHTASVVHESIQEIKKAIEDGRIEMSRIEEALQRVLKYKALYAGKFCEKKYDTQIKNNHTAQVDINSDQPKKSKYVISDSDQPKKSKYVLSDSGQPKKSKHVLSDSGQPVDLNLVGTVEQKTFMDGFYRECIDLYKPEGMDKMEVGQRPLWIGPYPARTSLVQNDEDKSFSFSSYLKEKFGGDAVFMSLNPNMDEIDLILNKTKWCSAIAVGTLNAHMNPGQVELVTKLAANLEKMGKPMAVAALRNPYDLEQMPKSIFRAALYEYSERALQAFSELLVQTGKILI
ncbi:glycoside hydrolase family 3 protein [Robinsoniella peoriensis]|uniref:Beta-hexosaminidase A n=1 Tax=Robinsoniella peoriensis TaxID=180332 RepID=A0A4V6HS39_9FIRM|nr:glycoside hydrolase family 3 protein [Robinsoniella peoriensis]MDU7029908.1 glycoside hydrolase family 3 protein [Clostridiales bacterium]TLD01458.1 Beta-hexosaminidase A precursor [Robinsoniella peoriensis]